MGPRISLAISLSHDRELSLSSRTLGYRFRAVESQLVVR
jgi:hypothetical protein